MELKDLCCVEACVLLAPNERQGTELVRLGLLELSLLSHLSIHCTLTSTTIEITETQLAAIQEHDIYKAFHIFLKEIYTSKTIAPLQEVISTAQKYFGLGLEGFNRYAITPSLNSKNITLQEHYKRFFIFKATRLKLTKGGEDLKTKLINNLDHPENLTKHHALLMPNESKAFTQTTLQLITCFNKAYFKEAKILKNSATNSVANSATNPSANSGKETGLF